MTLTFAQKIEQELQKAFDLKHDNNAKRKLKFFEEELKKINAVEVEAFLTMLGNYQKQTKKKASDHEKLNSIEAILFRGIRQQQLTDSKWLELQKNYLVFIMKIRIYKRFFILE